VAPGHDDSMAERSRATFTTRLGNTLITALLRSGVRMGNMFLLTVPGRKSGQPRTTPVALGERDGQRWLLSPYGEVDWVRNLRAAGGGTLTRGRHNERFTATALTPVEAAPLLKDSVASAPGFIRRHFAVAPGAPLADFARIAPAHPVFALQASPVGVGATRTE